MLSFWLVLIVLIANLSLLDALSSSSNKTIYSSIIYSYYGDRTPLALPIQNMLTPLGAQQLESAGSFFRQRYLEIPQGAEEADTTINGILNHNLDNSQVLIMSTPDQYVVASAQAFVQGLYPPFTGATSVFSNGTVIQAPLGGYQYPQILTVGPQDPNSIYIAGDAYCLAYDQGIANYKNSSESLQVKTDTQDFYSGFQSNILDGVIENASFDSAYLIFDYLNYGYTHNKTVRDKLSDNDLAMARGLADQKIHAINGNASADTSSSGSSVQTIAGQTLAAQIAEILIINAENAGAVNKLNLLFGSFQPMVAFAALAQLPKANTDFYGLPDYGSSMVIEMYSDQDNSGLVFPDLDKLYIRFLFRNGTDTSSSLHAYPLFGGGDTQILSFQDFLENVTSFAIPSVNDWCLTCQSNSGFCATYLTFNSDGGGDPTASSGAATKPMKPAVAGIIGAVICLVTTCIILALFMLVGGVRFHRSKAKRRSELGGFKAGEKLPSDQDLPRGEVVAGASIVKNDNERVKSWELEDRDMAKDRRPSYERDDVGLHLSLQPTKIDERV